MNNVLVVLENNRISLYWLDKKTEWDIGRKFRNNSPDISYIGKTVSRKHGMLRSIDGYWFYMDNNNKNGTVHNGKCIKAGLGGRVKPVMLNDGDTLIFGTRNNTSITCATSWAVFLENGFEGECRIMDTRATDRFGFTEGGRKEEIMKPQPGTVIKRESGMAIYMGDITYLFGEMQLTIA